MVFVPKDRIRSLISQVTEENLRDTCDEIHYQIRPYNGHEIIHTIAVSILDEATGSGHSLVPQYNLAGVCLAIHEICLDPVTGAGTFLSTSLPQHLDELCQKEFVDANRMLESGEGAEVVSSIILDLVALVGELYKLYLVKDEVVEKVYLENLRRNNRGSRAKADALSLLLQLVATRWEMYPTSRNINVEQYVQSLLDYTERHDPPAKLVEEIRDLAAQFRIEYRPQKSHSPSRSSRSSPAQRGEPQQPTFTPTIPDATEQHPVYFFLDGDVDLVCRSDDRRIAFRVHSPRLIHYSPVMAHLLSRDDLHQLPISDGRPQIPWDDDPVEFAALLEALYRQTLPFQTHRPPFREFASLLRLTIKYKIAVFRNALLASFRTVYAPDHGAVPTNGDYFGDPQPHPNEVLKLLYECQVQFTLPFAFYEACVAGIKSLTSTDPTIRLPPVLLSQAVRGFCKLKEWEWRLARSILFLDRQSHRSIMCRAPELPSTNSGSPLQDVLCALCPGFEVTTGSILHIPDLPRGGNCIDCVRRWNEIKDQAKVELWESLPEIFGMESWMGIYSEGSDRTT